MSAQAMDTVGRSSARASGLSSFRQPERVRKFKDNTASMSTLSSDPNRGVEIGGRTIFAATSPATGTELFVTDGTKQATGLLLRHKLDRQCEREPGVTSRPR